MKWKAGQNNQSTWLQYFSEDETFPILSFMRNRGAHSVKIILQELPDALLQEIPEEQRNDNQVFCYYSLQDYNGDECLLAENIGSLVFVTNGAGRRIFSSASPEGMNLEPFRIVIKNIREKFVLEVAGHERIFEIDGKNLHYLQEIYSDIEPMF
jgi:hypothetical protein